MADAELAAITVVVETLEPLEPSIRQRVLGYAAQRFGATMAPMIASPPNVAPPSGENTVMQGAPVPTQAARAWSDFGELFYAYKPNSNSEKVLIAGYWLQQVEQQPSFNSFEVNKKLKDMGEGIPKNIFRDFERLANESPSRIIFLSGSGSGRNRCKMTIPGIKSVEDRVAAAHV